MKRRLSVQASVTAAATLLVLATLGAVVLASPAANVTPTLVARGTYDAFKVKSDGAIEVEAEAKPAIDIVVRTHDYVPSTTVPIPTTGWHRHPGPVFITVKKGTLTYYHYDDPNCTPHIVSEGQGFVDDGHGHIVRNESGEPAQDVSVITAPVGGAFRHELSAPAPHCPF